MNFNETTHSMSGIYRILFENEKSYIGLTMQSIATYLKCDRKVISDINCGKRQKQLDWEYPLNK